MKRVISCILSFSLLLLLTSCSDDWTPYKKEEHIVNHKVEGNIFLISEIESELSTLVEKYADDVELTFVKYQFNNEITGTVEFQFFKEYEIKGKYYSVVITLLANIDDGIIYKLNYEEGISKRLTGYRNAIIRNNENAYNIYISHLCNIKLEERNELEYSNVIFSNENIIVCHYDKNNNLILRTEL